MPVGLFVGLQWSTLTPHGSRARSTRKDTTLTVHTETIDQEFSAEFAELLGGVLSALKLGEVEVHERFVVIQADPDRIIHVDVRAVLLQEVEVESVRTPVLRRPKRREPMKRKLHLVAL